jgi:hypothetical protein
MLVLPEGAVAAETGCEEPETGTGTGTEEGWTAGLSSLPPSGCETGAAAVDDIYCCDTVRSVLILRKGRCFWIVSQVSTRSRVKCLMFMLVN